MDLVTLVTFAGCWGVSGFESSCCCCVVAVCGGAGVPGCRVSGVWGDLGSVWLWGCCCWCER